MKHFYKKIHGWSTETDQLSLLKKILPKEHVIIAELGVWKGRQTAMWVVELLNKHYTFDYYAIDWFSSTYDIGYGTTTLQEVQKNLAAIIDKINIIKKSTQEAAAMFPDQYFDIVYIDSGHEYSSVKNDIEFWRPKVKVGGWLCGDDYIAGWPGVMKAVNEAFDKWNLRFIGRQKWAVQI